MMKIFNCPNEAWDYEFIVVKKVGGDFFYICHTADGFKADKTANEYLNGIVIHNVKIQGRKPTAKKKWFTFSGKWSWKCYAKDREDAETQFFDCCPAEDFDFEDDYTITEGE